MRDTNFKKTGIDIFSSSRTWLGGAEQKNNGQHLYLYLWKDLRVISASTHTQTRREDEHIFSKPQPQNVFKREQKKLRFEGGALDPQRSSKQDRERVGGDSGEKDALHAWTYLQTYLRGALWQPSPSLFFGSFVYIFAFFDRLILKERVFFFFLLLFYCTPRFFFFFFAPLYIFSPLVFLLFVYFYWILDLFNPTDPLTVGWNVISRGGLADDLFSTDAKTSSSCVIDPL